MVGFRIAKLDMAASEVGVSGSNGFCWFVAGVETKTKFKSLWDFERLGTGKNGPALCYLVYHGKYLCGNES
ncbi:hypothetical protein Tco_1513420 [Tanacetum coccineum]